jgi:hypothetical protein
MLRCPYLRQKRLRAVTSSRNRAREPLRCLILLTKPRQRRGHGRADWGHRLRPVRLSAVAGGCTNPRSRYSRIGRAVYGGRQIIGNDYQTPWKGITAGEERAMWGAVPPCLQPPMTLLARPTRPVGGPSIFDRLECQNCRPPKFCFSQPRPPDAAASTLCRTVSRRQLQPMVVENRVRAPPVTPPRRRPGIRRPAAAPHRTHQPRGDLPRGSQYNARPGND